MNTDKIYTTEELTEILKQEMQACIKGDRTFPMPDDAEEIVKQYPLGSILGAQRMFQMGCYHEFRDQVHKYQLEHNVSGLEIESYTIGSKSYRFPVPIHQLELTKDDYEVLKLAKDSMVDAFLDWCDEFTYLSFSHDGKGGAQFDIETTKQYVKHFAQFSDWAEMYQAEELEISICLGYGDYHASAFVSEHSDLASCSDSFYFVASRACKNYLPQH